MMVCCWSVTAQVDRLLPCILGRHADGDDASGADNAACACRAQCFAACYLTSVCSHTILHTANEKVVRGSVHISYVSLWLESCWTACIQVVSSIATSSLDLELFGTFGISCNSLSMF